AKASGLDLKAEDAEVSDGLADACTHGDRPAAARTAARRGAAAATPRPTAGAPALPEPRITDTAAPPRAYVDAYGRMLLIRRFEQAMHKLFLEGEVHGTTHLAAGQETGPVGVCMALDPEDYVAGTYRGHGHALAKGTDPGSLIAEMLGRATGICGRGRGRGCGAHAT